MITKPAPAAKMAADVPARLMTKPAAAGATMRVPCQMAEFSATALTITFRSIR